jgi:hypothetical protein
MGSAKIPEAIFSLWILSILQANPTLNPTHRKKPILEGIVYNPYKIPKAIDTTIIPQGFGRWVGSLDKQIHAFRKIQFSV